MSQGCSLVQCGLISPIVAGVVYSYNPASLGNNRPYEGKPSVTVYLHSSRKHFF
jgi:hypothetical protein